MSGALRIWLARIHGYPYFWLLSGCETRSPAIYSRSRGCLTVSTLSLEHRSGGNSKLNLIVGVLSDQITFGLNCR